MAQMFNSAKRIIRLSQQDLGPLCIPGLSTPHAMPGTGWPSHYFTALGNAIYSRADLFFSNFSAHADGER